jgi:AcrR family transcriptional regulator
MSESTHLRDLPAGRVDPRHRDRLIGGLLASIEERGYAATTIADIVRHAGVSKRTFYKHFADKEEALRALYAFASDNLDRRIVSALDGQADWRVQCYAGVRAFVQGLAEFPGLARTILLEMPAAGPLSLALRTEMHDRFAVTISAAAAAARREHPELNEITPDLAAAFIGAIYELIIRSLQRGEIDPDSVAHTATQLISAVVSAPPTGS